MEYIIIGILVVILILVVVVLIKSVNESNITERLGKMEANIGLTPNNNGEVVILNIPALTEETRREYVKQVKGLAEDCRIALRNVRQDANNDIKKLEITEDEVKEAQDEVQELINKYNKIVDEKLKVKEQELMTV